MTLTERAIARLNDLIDAARGDRDQARCTGNEIGAQCIDRMRDQLIALRDRMELRLCRDE